MKSAVRNHKVETSSETSLEEWGWGKENGREKEKRIEWREKEMRGRWMKKGKREMNNRKGTGEIR